MRHFHFSVRMVLEEFCNIINPCGTKFYLLEHAETYHTCTLCTKLVEAIVYDRDYFMRFKHSPMPRENDDSI